MTLELFNFVHNLCIELIYRQKLTFGADKSIVVEYLCCLAHARNKFEDVIIRAVRKPVTSWNR